MPFPEVPNACILFGIQKQCRCQPFCLTKPLCNKGHILHFKHKSQSCTYKNNCWPPLQKRHSLRPNFVKHNLLMAWCDESKRFPKTVKVNSCTANRASVSATNNVQRSVTNNGRHLWVVVHRVSENTPTTALTDWQRSCLAPC